MEVDTVSFNSFTSLFNSNDHAFQLDGSSEFVRSLYYNVTVSRYTKSMLRSLLEAANQSVSSLV